jgi:transcriptional regulator GlxA family with amidase domain
VWVISARVAEIGSFMPVETKMVSSRQPLHVSLVAISDAMLSSLSGLYDTLRSFDMVRDFDQTVPKDPPFQVEMVAPQRPLSATASGLPVGVDRTIDEIESSDVVIVPSLALAEGAWTTGRYPEVVQWLAHMHSRGAMICSACSGVLLVAETGLLDGWEATMHWAYSRTFHHNFPRVKLRLDEVLIATGQRKEFVMSGASASWHDLALYLIAKHVGPTAAQSVAKLLLLQWHKDGQAPYITFRAPEDHGDAAILNAQYWLQGHLQVANVVERMVEESGLPERSFKRRFTRATGYTPISYVQHLRIEEAKRRLERSDAPVDEISWAIGYEDPAFFRRLFKRVTRLTPSEYRRKFRLPYLPTSAPGHPSLQVVSQT